MAPYAISNGKVERPVRASSSRRHRGDREGEERTERNAPPRKSTNSTRTPRTAAGGDAASGSTPRSRPSTSGRTPRSARNSTSGPRPGKPSTAIPRAPRPAPAAASNSTPRSASTRDTSRSTRDAPPARRQSRHTVSTVPRDPTRTRRSERRDNPQSESRPLVSEEYSREHNRDTELDGAPGGTNKSTKTKSEDDKSKKKRRKSAAGAAASAAHNKHHRSKSKDKKAKEKAALLGGDLERGERGDKKKRFNCGKRFWILVAATVLLLIILIPVGVLVVGKKKDTANGDGALGLGNGEEESNINSVDPSSIPTDAKGTRFDPFTWLDTKDFNLTYTSKTVGGLSVMGLFDEYDDSTRANDNVPRLDEAFPYGKKPIRGVNVGGWLLVEPFITPSFFDGYAASRNVVDEFTLSRELGAKKAKETMENHYSKFVTETTFKEIRDAGLDHVRFPFGYWAVMTLDGDSFVPDVSWRYLLRGIEWARKYGLRVKLDLHSVPGGANGWNHSGRQGVIGWLYGKNGDENGEKTLKIHTQLATFFSQPRYKNIVTMYGLVNEPKMITLDPDKVITWTEQAYDAVRSAGYEGQIIFGDGFRGLSKWKGAFKGKSGMLLDVHQYTIFNTNQISLSHTEKVKFACQVWTDEMQSSVDTSSGFGPTMVGEWGQADTDCTKYLNNVGVGTRWEGDFHVESTGETVDKPSCNGGKDCSCEKANADPSDYSRIYIQFLKTFAEAQMDAFEKGWGWMYWTWDTESATQWSYKKSIAAGIIPKVAYERDFTCETSIPDFADLGLPENY